MYSQVSRIYIIHIQTEKTFEYGGELLSEIEWIFVEVYIETKSKCNKKPAITQFNLILYQVCHKIW